MVKVMVIVPVWPVLGVALGAVVSVAVMIMV